MEPAEAAIGTILSTSPNLTIYNHQYNPMKAFIEAYTEALLWTLNEADSHCTLLSDEAAARIKSDCEDFYDTHADLLEQAGSDEQNGHDFWLTRNGHGVGFWDRGYDKEVGNALTKACKKLGEVWAYAGDDGLLYLV